MSATGKLAETPSYNLSNFEIAQILSNNTRSKTIALLGKFPKVSDTDQAVVVMEKAAFVTDATEDSAAGYFSDETEFKVEFINNIYGNFQGLPPRHINKIKVTVVYPATDEHIAKYSSSEQFLVLETPALYEHVTKPYVDVSKFSLQWVYNILEHKKEKERIIFEDDDPETGFILLPDLKWDGHSMETFYLLAIVHARDVKSLRDLNEKHIPLLKSIRDKGSKAIEERFAITPSQLRAYVHYQPSFYHFHVHFNMLNNEVPGISCEKAHLLGTVIDNIELISDYYQKATLPFVLHDNALLKLIRKQEQN